MNARSLIDSKPVTPQRLTRVYNKLWTKADELIRQHRPCEFEPDAEGNVTCKEYRDRGLEAGLNTTCCRGCQHHTVEKGCRAKKPLACRSWLCGHMRREKPWLARKLDKVQRLASRAGLWSVRSDKPEAIRRAVDYYQRVPREDRVRAYYRNQEWRHEMERRFGARDVIDQAVR